MLNPRENAELEQSRALLMENFPPLWWGLFDNCVKQGFTRQEALELIKAYIIMKEK